MKAVNLIPVDARRSGSSVRDAAKPTLALLATLGVALLAVVAYVLVANSVTAKRDVLTGLQAQANAVQRDSAQLQAFGDLNALREHSLATVQALAQTRFDWPKVMSQLSRLVPADVTLTTFDGAVNADLSGAPAPPVTGSPGASAPTGPTIQLSGCTTSHSAVARMMERMARIDGVTDVQLASSTADPSGATPGGGPVKAAPSGANSDCGRSKQFQMTLTLAPPSAGAATAGTPALAAGASATTSPPAVTP